MNYNLVIMETFGQWLLRHRKKLDLKQSDVAERAQVSVSYISTLEREQPHTITGKDITPDKEKVVAIAKAVGGNINEALRLFGYASETDVPQLIIDALGSTGSLNYEDMEEIANYIKFKKSQKK